MLLKYRLILENILSMIKIKIQLKFFLSNHFTFKSLSYSLIYEIFSLEILFKLTRFCFIIDLKVKYLTKYLIIETFLMFLKIVRINWDKALMQISSSKYQ